MGNSPNKDTRTFNGVISSHPGSLKTRFERILIIYPTVLFTTRDEEENFGEFNIYFKYYSQSSQSKACSFPLWNPIKHTFRFHRVSWLKS